MKTFTLLAFALSLQAEVRLPALISDHMLLQRDVPVRIWGKADPSEKVAVTFRGETVNTVADNYGRWNAFLSAKPAGGPFELTVQGANTLTVQDVLVGDVWVASGQSNMQWDLAHSDNGEKEVAAADNPQIRIFKVPFVISQVPMDDFTKGKWQVCTPKTISGFSAAGYFFARHLNHKLKVPMGVIGTYWGGTPAESWISGPGLASDPALISVYADWAKLMNDYPEATLKYEAALKGYDEAVAKAKAEGKPEPTKPRPPTGPNNQLMPSSLYNAMIAPLTRYAIRGAIWYQGENNAGTKRAYVYRRLFPAMIQDWRNNWGLGDFPFLFVQLANYGKNTGTTEWPELREAQLMTLQLRNTGMAVTIDIGNPNDIHPTNKQDVGLRLALAARSIAYGEKLVYSGPIFRQAVREGRGFRIFFDHVGGGLVAKGGELKGFTLLGSKRIPIPAEARIEKDSIVVTTKELKSPIAVRYGWAESPECNLYNAEGLPASPFRSDEWAEPKQYR